MADKDDIEIEIVDDPQQAEGASVDTALDAAPEPAKRLDPEDGVDVLRGQLDREAQNRRNAEEAARQAQARAAASDINAVALGIDNLKTKVDGIRKAKIEALAAGDLETAETLNDELIETHYNLRRLQEGHEALKNRPAETTQDPVEYLAGQLTPKSAAWVRAHPEFAQGENYNAMMAAHALTLRRGIVAETPEYFDAVEETLGIQRPRRERQAPAELDDADSPFSGAATQAKPRDSAPPAAPPSRNGAGSPAQSTNPNRIRLTREQIEMAESMGQTPQEYAKNLIELRKQGRVS